MVVVLQNAKSLIFGRLPLLGGCPSYPSTDEADKLAARKEVEKRMAQKWGLKPEPTKGMTRQEKKV